MIFSPKIETLINNLKHLPGVGNKSAQRIAYHILQKIQLEAKSLSKAIDDAIEHVGHCNSCNILTEDDICAICISPRRNAQLVCVVESPSDVVAIEHSGSYNGVYFVLQGHLSPIDGIGPEEIGIPKLLETISSKNIQEIILATSATVEGEATAHYIYSIAKKLGVTISRIAHGVPIGGELEYIDSMTISRALLNRGTID